MAKIDKTITDKEWYQMYWNYFELMSQQRLKMLNYYISIEIVLFGGMFTLLQLKTRMLWAEYIVSFAISFMSLMFAGIDFRNKTVIHKCEELLSWMESWYNNDRVVPGLIDYVNKWDEDSIFRMTYSKWFFIQFLLIGITGIVFAWMLYTNKL